MRRLCFLLLPTLALFVWISKKPILRPAFYPLPKKQGMCSLARNLLTEDLAIVSLELLNALVS